MRMLESKRRIKNVKIKQKKKNESQPEATHKKNWGKRKCVLNLHFPFPQN